MQVHQDPMQLLDWSTPFDDGKIRLLETVVDVMY